MALSAQVNFGCLAALDGVAVPQELGLQMKNDRLAHRIGRAFLQAYKRKSELSLSPGGYVGMAGRQGPEPNMKPKS